MNTSSVCTLSFSISRKNLFLGETTATSARDAAAVVVAAAVDVLSNRFCTMTSKEARTLRLLQLLFVVVDAPSFDVLSLNTTRLSFSGRAEYGRLDLRLLAAAAAEERLCLGRQKKNDNSLDWLRRGDGCFQE